MVVISETLDGSNGGDPNKIPQEQEEVKKSFAQTPSDITEHCFAITRRCHYPKLSLASKEFCRIIRSPKLYEKRLTLGVTEPVLYASVGFPRSESPSWYILHRNHVDKPLRLCNIASLPRALWGSAVVTIGPMIYVIGGSIGRTPTSNVTLIDCRFHTYESLPRMRRARSRAVAGAIDGKIYVIGGCKKQDENWVEEFDVKNKVWSDVPCSSALLFLHWKGQFVTSAVMNEKIYVLDPLTCFIFDPSVRKLLDLENGYALREFWQASSCVVDNMLYTIDPGGSKGSEILCYDPKAEYKWWRPVYFVDDRKLPPFISYYDSKMANLGGKLVILVGNGSLFPLDPFGVEEIWCIQISLVSGEPEGDDFQLQAKFESMDLVYTSLKWPSIELSTSVTI